MDRKQTERRTSDFLAILAEDIATACEDQTAPRAMLLTGSAAECVSDAFSDLDLIAYYDDLPTDGALAAARRLIGAADVRVSAHRERGSIIEEFVLQGVECQLAHATISSWEQTMATVLKDHTPGTLAEKAISGLLDGVAVSGHDLVKQWQAQAADYPDELARATVAHYLQFFPLWMTIERLDQRDATIFYHQMLVEGSLNLLGVLSGLNRCYFSTFQFKRLHRFACRLRLAPERLADRLDELFTLDRANAGISLERLVDETTSLVEVHMPEIDTAAARRHIGIRQRPWAPNGALDSTER